MSGMQYRTFGRCGVPVSEISFGSWAIGGVAERLGVHWGWANVDRGQACAAVRKARELGVNFFDTADVYGHSEDILGEVLRGDDAALIASKTGNVVRDGAFAKDWSRKHIVASCEQSLRRLRRERLDVFLLHNPDAAEIRDGDWPETMELLRTQGKIRWYGVSIFLPEEALAVLDRDAGQVIELAHNVLRQEMTAAVLPRAQQQSFGIIGRVPLYYGVLTGKYHAATTFPAEDHRSHTLPPATLRELAPRAQRFAALNDTGASFAQWSLKFAMAHPAISTIIVGARDATQAAENFAVSDGRALPPDRLRRAAKMWREDAYLAALRDPL